MVPTASDRLRFSVTGPGEIVAVDAGELVTWARTFIGRIVRFESDNRYIVNRFYDDIRRMTEMYGGGVLQ